MNEIPDYINKETLDAVYSHFGYKLFPNNADVVLTGWRLKNARPNYFDDFFTVFSPINGVFRGYPITTRPGTSWLKRLMNPKGAAILKPGQYIDAYQIGQHKGEVALRQVRPVSVYRDCNLDVKCDTDEKTVETGMFGLHIHAVGSYSLLVNLWSAGCQVFQYRSDLINLCQTFLTKTGPYTYTLVEV